MYYLYIVLSYEQDEADLIPVSKRERAAIRSWRQIKRVTRQQLIGYLRLT